MFKGVIKKATDAVKLYNQKSDKDSIKAKLQKCLEELQKLNTKKSVSSVNSSNLKVGPVDDFRSTSEYERFVKKYREKHPEMQGPSNAETAEKRKKAMNNAYKAYKASKK
jgi:hypothetical protein